MDLFALTYDSDELSSCSSIDDLPEFPGVYLLFDGPSLIYVGQSVNIAHRQTQHKRDKDWFPEEPRWAFLELPTLTDRLIAETVLIMRHFPRYNYTIKLGLGKKKPQTLHELQFLRGKRSY